MGRRAIEVASSSLMRLARDGRTAVPLPAIRAYLLVDLDRDGGLFVAINSDRARPVMQSVRWAWGRWHDIDPPTFF
jgi:hypothetical protein